MKKVYTNENKYYKIIKFYKNKLVELGEMRELSNSCFSEGTYTKGPKKKKRGRKAKAKVSKV